ncbi:MAG: hypothetical protein K2W96_05620, partial [Gemmataceae bacterium]|nr:hypothetical protein [Gemmataceae bacterium]
MTALLALLALSAPPVHLWHEPEWWPGVEGGFNYWTGTHKPTGKWGIAGPGISAEWSQGGESGWNSIGAHADDSKAECGREIALPRSDKYRVWVRYVEHRRKKTPFTLKVGDKAHVFGERAVLPLDDEYLLYWGFAFSWDSFDAELKEGKSTLKLVIDKKGEAWRQVDAILLTTDLGWKPEGRAKPPFRHRSALGGERAAPPAFSIPAKARPKLGGGSFSLWTGVEADPKWWDTQKDGLALADVFHAHS